MKKAYWVGAGLLVAFLVLYKTAGLGTFSIPRLVAAPVDPQLQLWLFLRFLGAPSDLATVALVFLVARVLDLAAFLVPARLGVQEGARMVAMRLAGLDPSLGLLFSLVLRLEQMVWAGIGLAAYAALAAGREPRVRVAP